MNVAERVADILYRCADEIRANMDMENINASHRTEKSLRVVQTAKSASLVIGGDRTAPLATLELGRPGGAVPRNFTDIIYEWMRDKGIASGNAKEDRRIAGAIAWGKIRPFGTNRHAHHVNVYSTAVRDAVDKANRDIGLLLVGEVEQVVNTNFFKL